MEESAKQFPLDAFSELVDGRSARNQLHSLADIVFLTICAVVSGADSWTEVENFGELKQDWLRKYVRLANGIPSHDTLGRFFAMLDPEGFEKSFKKWVSEVAESVGGEVISIDGKTLCGSYDKYSNKGAIHIVSAWAGSNRIVLGQAKTRDKSNEITAIPALLAVLAICGCIVTIDAMGCQTDIAKLIREKNADYLIAVKGNQPNLMEGVRRSFDLLKPELVNEQVDCGHGRVETRKCEVITDLKWVESRGDWKDIHAVVKITSTRHLKLQNKTTAETRYYITSSKADAEAINRAIQMHWGIENSLHWVLDVVFSEDKARNRAGNSDHNLSIVRRIALNIIKLDTTRKGSINIKRQSAAISDAYREKLIGV